MGTLCVRAVFAMAACSACAWAQPLMWKQLAGSGQRPSARIDGTIAWDPDGGQIFLFGGQDGTSAKNDLWAFSIDSGRWSQVTAGGAAPPARSYHAMVFDSARRRLLVFGGAGGGNLNDTWAFDIAAARWSQIGQNGAPGRRHGHSAIYDAARDRLVVSHGFSDTGRFNDTWALDLRSGTWSNLTPAGAKPLNRCLHHAVYDAAGGQMYLYGGCSSGYGPCPQGDLWSFDLNTNQWRERTPKTSPPARSLYGMAFDSTRGKLILFGGVGDSSSLNDTWEFDPAAGTWQASALSGTSPAARQRLESAWAPGTGMVFFGGLTDAGLSNELWTLAAVSAGPSVSTGGVVDAFSGIGNAVAPGEDISIYGSGLGPAVGAAQTFDATNRTLPISAEGVSVTWNGIASPLYYVSAGQINAQAPYELAGSSEASLVVTVNGQASAASKIAVAAVHPSLFPRVFNADGSVNSPANPAKPGSVIFFYASGQGVTSPASTTGAAAVGVYPDPVAPVGVSIGGVPAEVLFKGQAPYTAGVMQMNARLAAGTPSGDSVPLSLMVGGIAGHDGVTVAIRP